MTNLNKGYKTVNITSELNELNELEFAHGDPLFKSRMNFEDL